MKYVAAFFLSLSNQHAYAFDKLTAVDISFNSLSPIDEIKLRTYFKSVNNPNTIGTAIKNTFINLGFTSTNNGKSYEKKFQSCIDESIKLSECVVVGKIHFLTSTSLTTFSLTFFTDDKKVTSADLYSKFYEELDKNLSD